MSKAKRVNIKGRWFGRLRFTTQQPSFSPDGLAPLSVVGGGDTKKKDFICSCHGYAPSATKRDTKVGMCKLGGMLCKQGYVKSFAGHSFGFRSLMCQQGLLEHTNVSETKQQRTIRQNILADAASWAI